MSEALRPFRTAAIIAVGSELLTPFRTDTNSLAVTARLNELGIVVVHKQVSRDSAADLGEAFRHAQARADLVVLTGGLGPTSDDVTRSVIARELGLPLVEDPVVLERIRSRFAARGIEMPVINRVQAQVPSGAHLVPNANGTAPGLWIPVGDCAVLLLPGPPRELGPMLDRVLTEQVAPRTEHRRLLRRVLQIAGRTESQVEATAQPIYGRWERHDPPVATTILAKPGQIELHLSLVVADEVAGREVLEAAVGELAAALGTDVYSVDGRSLEVVVGDLLTVRGWRIALGESCTGGLLASRLTDVAGASRYLDRGVVTYSNRAKTELLGVPPALIETHGAVSEPVAQAMAAGARQSGGVEVGVGISGIAGPGGGTAQKPAGTVCIAVDWPGGTHAGTYRFLGGREQVKFQSTQVALDLVRRVLTGCL